MPLWKCFIIQSLSPLSMAPFYFFYWSLTLVCSNQIQRLPSGCTTIVSASSYSGSQSHWEQSDFFAALLWWLPRDSHRRHPQHHPPLPCHIYQWDTKKQRYRVYMFNIYTYQVFRHYWHTPSSWVAILWKTRGKWLESQSWLHCLSRCKVTK
jgi:hypothetical protein